MNKEKAPIPWKILPDILAQQYMYCSVLLPSGMQPMAVDSGSSGKNNRGTSRWWCYNKGLHWKRPRRWWYQCLPCKGWQNSRHRWHLFEGADRLLIPCKNKVYLRLPTWWNTGWETPLKNMKENFRKLRRYICFLVIQYIFQGR